MTQIPDTFERTLQVEVEKRNQRKKMLQEAAKIKKEHGDSGPEAAEATKKCCKLSG